MLLTFRIALTYLHKRNSYLPSFTAVASTLGVAFGVAAFLVVVTVLNSFEAELKNSLQRANPNMLIFSTKRIPNVAEFKDKVANLISKPVDGISLFEYSEVIITNKQHSVAAVLKGIEGSKSASSKDLIKIISPTDALEKLDSPQVSANNIEKLPGIIIGKYLALKLEAQIGDELNIVSNKDAINTGVQKVKVVGTLSVGLSQYDEKLALLSFTDAVSLFGEPGSARGIEVKFKNPNHALAVAEELSDKIPYEIKPWQEIDKGLFQVVERDGASIKAIVLVIALVAAFNIIATLSLSVTDRRKQIALLRSLGATRMFIIKVFVITSLILGTIGSLVGVLMGTIILQIFANYKIGDLQTFYILEKIPVEFNVQYIISAVFVAILLSFLSSLYPAWKATRVSPLFGLKTNL